MDEDFESLNDRDPSFRKRHGLDESSGVPEHKIVKEEKGSFHTLHENDEASEASMQDDNETLSLSRRSSSASLADSTSSRSGLSSRIFRRRGQSNGYVSDSDSETDTPGPLSEGARRALRRRRLQEMRGSVVEKANADELMNDDVSDEEEPPALILSKSAPADDDSRRNAAIRLQSFLRGCLTRERVSSMIAELIEKLRSNVADDTPRPSTASIPNEEEGDGDDTGSVDSFNVESEEFKTYLQREYGDNTNAENDGSVPDPEEIGFIPMMSPNVDKPKNRSGPSWVNLSKGILDSFADDPAPTDSKETEKGSGDNLEEDTHTVEEVPKSPTPREDSPEPEIHDINDRIDRYHARGHEVKVSDVSHKRATNFESLSPVNVVKQKYEFKPTPTSNELVSPKRRAAEGIKQRMSLLGLAKGPPLLDNDPNSGEGALLDDGAEISSQTENGPPEAEPKEASEMQKRRASKGILARMSMLGVAGMSPVSDFAGLMEEDDIDPDDVGAYNQHADNYDIDANDDDDDSSLDEAAHEYVVQSSATKIQALTRGYSFRKKKPKPDAKVAKWLQAKKQESQARDIYAIPAIEAAKAAGKAAAAMPPPPAPEPREPVQEAPLPSFQEKHQQYLETTTVEVVEPIVATVTQEESIARMTTAQKRMHTAAIKIQSLVRGFLVRLVDYHDVLYTADLLDYYRFQGGAKGEDDVQATIDPNMTTEAIRSLTERNVAMFRAATKIQALVRGYNCRKFDLTSMMKVMKYLKVQKEGKPAPTVDEMDVDVPEPEVEDLEAAWDFLEKNQQDQTTMGTVVKPKENVKELLHTWEWIQKQERSKSIQKYQLQEEMPKMTVSTESNTEPKMESGSSTDVVGLARIPPGLEELMLFKSWLIQNGLSDDVDPLTITDSELYKDISRIPTTTDTGASEKESVGHSTLPMTRSAKGISRNPFAAGFGKTSSPPNKSGDVETQNSSLQFPDKVTVTSQTAPPATMDVEAKSDVSINAEPVSMSPSLLTRVRTSADASDCNVAGELKSAGDESGPEITVLEQSLATEEVSRVHEQSTQSRPTNAPITPIEPLVKPPAARGLPVVNDINTSLPAPDTTSRIAELLGSSHDTMGSEITGSSWKDSEMLLRKRLQGIKATKMVDFDEILELWGWLEENGADLTRFRKQFLASGSNFDDGGDGLKSIKAWQLAQPGAKIRTMADEGSEKPKAPLPTNRMNQYMSFLGPKKESSNQRGPTGSVGMGIEYLNEDLSGAYKNRFGTQTQFRKPDEPMRTSATLDLPNEKSPSTIEFIDNDLSNVYKSKSKANPGKAQTVTTKGDLKESGSGIEYIDEDLSDAYKRLAVQISCATEAADDLKKFGSGIEYIDEDLSDAYKRVAEQKANVDEVKAESGIEYIDEDLSNVYKRMAVQLTRAAEVADDRRKAVSGIEYIDEDLSDVYKQLAVQMASAAAASDDLKKSGSGIKYIDEDLSDAYRCLAAQITSAADASEVVEKSTSGIEYIDEDLSDVYKRLALQMARAATASRPTSESGTGIDNVDDNQSSICNDQDGIGNPEEPSLEEMVKYWGFSKKHATEAPRSTQEAQIEKEKDTVTDPSDIAKSKSSQDKMMETLKWLDRRGLNLNDISENMEKSSSQAEVNEPEETVAVVEENAPTINLEKDDVLSTMQWLTSKGFGKRGIDGSNTSEATSVSLNEIIVEKSGPPKSEDLADALLSLKQFSESESLAATTNGEMSREKTNHGLYDSDVLHSLSWLQKHGFNLDKSTKKIDSPSVLESPEETESEEPSMDAMIDALETIEASTPSRSSKKKRPERTSSTKDIDKAMKWLISHGMLSATKTKAATQTTSSPEDRTRDRSDDVLLVSQTAVETTKPLETPPTPKEVATSPVVSTAPNKKPKEKRPSGVSAGEMSSALSWLSKRGIRANTSKLAHDTHIDGMSTPTVSDAEVALQNAKSRLKASKSKQPNTTDANEPSPTELEEAVKFLKLRSNSSVQPPPRPPTFEKTEKALSLLKKSSKSKSKKDKKEKETKSSATQNWNVALNFLGKRALTASRLAGEDQSNDPVDDDREPDDDETPVPVSGSATREETKIPRKGRKPLGGKSPKVLPKEHLQQVEPPKVSLGEVKKSPRSRRSVTDADVQSAAMIGKAVASPVQKSPRQKKRGSVSRKREKEPPNQGASIGLSDKLKTPSLSADRDSAAQLSSPKPKTQTKTEAQSKSSNGRRDDQTPKRTAIKGAEQTKTENAIKSEMSQNVNFKNALKFLNNKEDDRLPDAVHFKKLDKILPKRSTQSDVERAKEMVKALNFVKKQGIMGHGNSKSETPKATSKTTRAPPKGPTPTNVVEARKAMIESKKEEKQDKEKVKEKEKTSKWTEARKNLPTVKELAKQAKAREKAKAEAVPEKKPDVVSSAVVGGDVSKAAFHWLKKGKSEDVAGATKFKKLDTMIPKKKGQTVEARAEELAKAFKFLQKKGAMEDKRTPEERDFDNALNYIKTKNAGGDVSSLEDSVHFKKLDNMLPKKTSETVEDRAKGMVKLLGWLRKKGKA
eukprot:Nitzschia sp. Nitz4//scaffold16_size188269//149328//156944//NITZ4_001813-RA/size188269-snap-gene-0.149-mRNA-1//-1//CDS//3329538583//5173//frame0